jgi:hypothetical protein
MLGLFDRPADEKALGALLRRGCAMRAKLMSFQGLFHGGALELKCSATNYTRDGTLGWVISNGCRFSNL